MDTNVRATVSLADGSNLGPIGIATWSLLQGAHEFEHNFMVYKHLLHLVILGLYFAQHFKVGIDLSHQGHPYLHQDYKSLTYPKSSPSKDPTVFSFKCSEARFISRTNIFILP